MKKLLIAPLLLLTATAGFAEQVFVHDVNEPLFPAAAAHMKVDGKEAAKNFLKDKLARGGSQTEDFVSKGVTEDALGQTHYKFQQTIKGLPVYGAEMIVHVDKNSGKAKSYNGNFAKDEDFAKHPSIDSFSALRRAAAQLGITNGRFLGNGELTYVLNSKERVYLSWTAQVEYVDAAGDEQRDQIFADATTGDLVFRDAKIHRARNRQTYNGNNTTSLPGTLVLSEASAPSSDVTLQAAHNGAGTTYDYYKAIHNRDSYDNAGATLKSTVHHSTNYNNAFWNGSQMVYGDGDGTTFAPLSRSLDVCAHELTHAVTERTAGLVYSNESGALNEGMSDILGAATEAWKRGTVDSAVWLIGDEIYTPSTAGDALRYMANPTQDGSSKDYYPERYVGTQDNGGVHWNSGIANLAFKLMVTGGTHPRGKTTVSVPALDPTATTSITMAAKIFYRALTVYLTSSSNFQAARNATASAATDLYGATAAAAVQKAWDAVGAPGGAAPPSTTVTLSNNVTVTGISASTGAWKHYKIAVPTGQTQLKITMSGGTGDGDMYVKRGAQPTSTVYDYRPYLSGNNETVTVANPVAGDWFISIYAYSTFSGVSLNANYTGAAPPPSCTTYTGSLAGTGSNAYAPTSSGYVSSVSGSHTGKLTGTGSDFDLYLEKWNGSSWARVGAGESSTSTENVTYSGTSGTYRWRIYSYSGSGTYSLCTTKP